MRCRINGSSKISSARSEPTALRHATRARHDRALRSSKRFTGRRRAGCLRSRRFFRGGGQSAVFTATLHPCSSDNRRREKGRNKKPPFSFLLFCSSQRQFQPVRVVDCAAYLTNNISL